MGRQDTFTTEVASSYGLNGSSRSTAAMDYITDLLGELQTIATVSGLTHLSDDLRSVVSKHVGGNTSA